MLQSFGWLIIFIKSQLFPLPRLQYLGVSIDSSGEGVPSTEEDTPLDLDGPRSEDESFDTSKNCMRVLINAAVPNVAWAQWHLKCLKFALLQQWVKLTVRTSLLKEDRRE